MVFIKKMIFYALLIIGLCTLDFKNLQFAEARDAGGFEACMASCESRRNICYRSSDKSRCAHEYQSCVIRCQRYLSGGGGRNGGGYGGY